MTSVSKFMYVGNIGVRRVTLCGQGSVQYLDHARARSVRGSVILDFSSDEEMYKFLQKMIDARVPFLRSHKQEVDRLILSFRETGYVNGKIFIIDGLPFGNVIEK